MVEEPTKPLILNVLAKPPRMETKDQMESQSVKEQQRRKRYHHKTKAGCKTCKIRKVKCDETRPFCQRCIKFGLGCDGYEDDSELNQPRKFTHGQVFPNHNRRAVVPQIRPPSTSVCRSPQRSLFSSQQEARYFSVFSTYTATQLTGLFASNLWKRLVLQACENNTPIRHAVIAIGALDPKTWRGPAKSDEETSRRQFAYYEYSIAISEMRKTTTEKSLDLRTRLIACFLFICFEMYHCNKMSAVSQIKAMSSLLETSSQNNDHPSQNLEDDLVASFQELQLQALVQNCWGTDLISAQQRLSCRQTQRDKIPLRFETIRQARSVFHLLTMRQLRWQGISRYDWPWYISTQTMGSMTDPPPNEWTSNEEWCLERDRRFEEYTAWSNAFQPLLLEARTSGKPDELRRAEVLRMNFLYSYLSMMTRMLSPQESYYGQTPRLTELLTLLKSLLESASEDNGFSMECNFLLPLSLVSYQFRHRALRQEAIRLLLTYPRREGLWDGVLIGKYSQWLAEFEEEDLGGEEYVPYDLVAGLAGAEHDPIRRTVRLVAFKRVRNPAGTRVRREAVLSW